MATRFTSAQIGTTILSLATGVVLGVVGNSYFQGNVQVIGDISASGTITQSGGLVPIRGTLSGSGQLSIQNPTGAKLKCWNPTLYTVTAANPVSTVDVEISARGGVPQNSTGVLLDNVAFVANDLRTGTGAAGTIGTRPKFFLLDEAGGTYDYIYIRGVSNSGAGVLAYFHADCYRIWR